MSTTFELPAPAKLNLFLHIVGRRPDGFHELQTVFALLDWGDTIKITSNDSGAITRVGESPIPVEDDLAIRAAQLLQPYTSKGADIEVCKRIPTGAGMGGGSSDAATVLHGLNAIWGLQLSADQLAEIGLTLGADVPVFVRGTHAWAEGVGEQLTPIELPHRWYLCVKPAIHSNTGTLFTDQRLTRDAKRVKISDFLAGHALGNAFEPVLRSREPQIDELFERLSAYGTPRLTGSGSVVFVEFADRDSADAALQALLAMSHQRHDIDSNITIEYAWVAASANTPSPLPARLASLHNQFLQGCRQVA